jgi:hypothetical protein
MWGPGVAGEERGAPAGRPLSWRSWSIAMGFAPAGVGEVRLSHVLDALADLLGALDAGADGGLVDRR